ncbi:hypothetical protein T439DRAFT_338697 [Meredithblackwellia eburnea MCA 4105]
MTTRSVLNGETAEWPFITAKDPLKNLLPGYKLAQQQHSTTPHAVFTNDIEKSPNDDRSYRLVTLQNGLEALIISDPTTDKAAGALNVKAGHLQDPEDIPGLAHFCEHLLFMGTEKYPAENEYTDFLAKNSGTSNAFTDLDQTCYYFDCHPTALEPALDRFAQFFISPLFDPSCTEREALAVDSENTKNLQSDMFRNYQLDKSTSSRDHVYWKFGTGNRETLLDEPLKAGMDVRKRLIEWKEKYYSANLMKLVVVGKDSLDDLTKIVVDHFSPATNQHLTPPWFEGSPLTEKQLKNTIYVKTVKDTRFLELTFPLPDEGPFHSTKPGSFISHFIGHEGPGSLLSHLKSKGWANGISAGSGYGASGFDFFKVSVDLTQSGLEHHTDVAQAVFAYIELLKSQPPQQWAFDEIKTVSELGFRFKEKSPPTQTAANLSLLMSRPYPRERVLSAPLVTTSWRPDVIQRYMNLLGPETCRMMVGNNEPTVNLTDKEKWYGTEYTIKPMDEQLLQGKAPTDFEEVHLPKPNSFIPTNIEIQNKQEVAVPAKRPLSIHNTPLTRVWHKKDDRWWVPRAAAFFLLRSPIVDNTAFNAVHSKLATQVIQDSLQEYAYDAEIAGLSYGFDTQGDGITVSIDGYNDKLSVLAGVVFDKIKNFKVDAQTFERMKDRLRRSLENRRLDDPYKNVASLMAHFTIEIMWTHEARLAEIDNVTVESLQAYVADLIGRLHVEVLVHGNMLKNEAMQLAKVPETILAPNPLTPVELLSHRALVIPEGKFLVNTEAPNPAELNSSVEQFTYLGDLMNEGFRTKLYVLAHLVQEPLFDDLRTKQQLGYIVSSGVRSTIGQIGLRVIVQSEKSASYVESKIDNFWDAYKTILDSMEESEFEKHKQSVINSLTEDHKNMWQESSHLWLNIISGYYNFERKASDAEKIKSITKADIVSFFDTHFFDSPEHPIRRLSVYVQSQRLQPEALQLLKPELKALGVEVDEAQFDELSASKPTLESLKLISRQFLASKGVKEEAITNYVDKLEEIVIPKLSGNVTLVTDHDMFRKSLELGPHATPAEMYSDLFPKL